MNKTISKTVSKFSEIQQELKFVVCLKQTDAKKGLSVSSLKAFIIYIYQIKIIL